MCAALRLPTLGSRRRVACNSHPAWSEHDVCNVSFHQDSQRDAKRSLTWRFAETRQPVGVISSNTIDPRACWSWRYRQVSARLIGISLRGTHPHIPKHAHLERANSSTCHTGSRESHRLQRKYPRALTMTPGQTEPGPARRESLALMEISFEEFRKTKVSDRLHALRAKLIHLSAHFTVTTDGYPGWRNTAWP